MTQTLSAHLAARFEDDARALRARATALRARPQSGGPSADACLTMATACDRVQALFASAIDDAAVRAASVDLERILADERDADARHVYSGAITRLRQSLGDEDVDAADDDDDEDEDDDED